MAIPSLILFAALSAEAAELRYDPRAPIPSGYHVERRVRYGMLISGGVVFTAGAGFFAKDPKGYLGAFGLAGMITGSVLFLVGAFSRPRVLVPDTVAPVPIVAAGFAGLNVHGSF